MRKIPLEIALIAIGNDPDTAGKIVLSCVETSNREAGRFVRRWLRDPEVVAIGTSRPRPDISVLLLPFRFLTINRAGA